MKFDKRAGDVLIWALLLSAPFWLPLAGSYVELGTRVVIYALAAMALNFLLGYTGVLSFGHAAYFGLGAYGTALTIKYLVPELRRSACWPASCSAPSPPPSSAR